MKDKGISSVTVLILVSILAVIVILTLILLPKKTNKSGLNVPVFSPSPSSAAYFSPVTLSTDQKTQVNKTTQFQVQQLPNIINQQTLPDGSVQYNLKSIDPNRPGVIIVKNGVVVYEKDLLLDESSNSTLKMADIISKYGQPDAIVNGSSYYGFSITTYIYASKGLAVIGNTYANKVYELQTFEPTTVDQYKIQYGQDLNTSASPAPEGISQQEEGILNFKSSLPYYSQNLTILYDKSKDQTTAYIDQNNKTQGDQALTNYLEKFGITDKSQVNNLNVVYQ